MNNVYRSKHGPLRLLVLCTLVLALGLGNAQAEDLQEGFIITKVNYAEIKDKTFEGKTIASMVPERMEQMIMDFGLTITLGHSEKIELDPKYVAYSKKNVKEVKYDPATRTMSGWQAGQPFPPEVISLDDPNAGDKVIWNLRGVTYGAIMGFNDFNFTFIKGDKGVERNQEWVSSRYFMEGRLDGGPLIVGDGTIQQKTYIVAIAPRDIRGLGTFSIRYNDVHSKKPDDTWAYLKSVRRTRRLSGGAWMDPIGGTDQLYDDWDIFDAFPTKYKSIKLLEKRWILAVAHSPKDSVDPTKTDMVEKLPSINLKEAPYYWPAKRVKWEPREVYVVEAIPPKEHPYGKKVVYIEIDHPRPYLGEFYDKKGEFWKYYIDQSRPDVGKTDGYKGVVPVVGHVVDLKRNHATIWSINMEVNPGGVTSDDVTLSKLEELATGAR